MIEGKQVMIDESIGDSCSKGLRRGGKGSVRPYTEQHLQWARVLDWARTGGCQPIDFAAPLTCQPF
jgi:hypothetical protein